MKKLVRIFVLIFTFLFSACEEPFSPKVELEDNYAVSCVIGVNSLWDTFSLNVYITSLYDVEGLNPYLNEVDPTISGANVILTYAHDSEYELQEDTTIYYDYFNPDSIVYIHYNRYDNPYILYRASDIPIKPYALLLDIELPNGKKLYSETKFPRGIFFEYSYDFPHGFTSNIDQWRHGDSWDIEWEPKDDQLYFSSLILNYIIDDGITSEYYSVEIPLKYVVHENENIPIYPSYEKVGKLEYNFSAVDKIFRSLADETENASNITIYDLILTVVQFDKELAQYYSSTNGYLDEHTVRLDEQIYSNITGGIGIFGTYKANSIPHQVDKDYIRSFGYNSSSGN